MSQIIVLPRQQIFFEKASNYRSDLSFSIFPLIGVMDPGPEKEVCGIYFIGLRFRALGHFCLCLNEAQGPLLPS